MVNVSQTISCGCTKSYFKPKTSRFKLVAQLKIENHTTYDRPLTKISKCLWKAPFMQQKSFREFNAITPVFVSRCVKSAKHNASEKHQPIPHTMPKAKSIILGATKAGIHPRSFGWVEFLTLT